MKKIVLCLSTLLLSCALQAEQKNCSFKLAQETITIDTHSYNTLEKTLEQNVPSWETFSDREKGLFIQDEILFCYIEALLKNEALSDTEKRDNFIQLFNQMHNKSHRKQAGTILAPIVSFTQPPLQAELVKIVLGAGVTTDLLPGEFYNDKYFPDGTSVIDTAQKYAQDKLAEVKNTVLETLEKIKTFIDEIV